MKRIALLGAGGHSRAQHGAPWRALAEAHPDRVKLVAVCDLDASKARAFCDELGFRRAYTDVREMLDKERLDGLVTVTPIEATERIVLDLLPARIPMVIEKPPGRSAEAAARLRDAARTHGAPHMVSFNRRFSPAITRARQWLTDRGTGGVVRMVIARMLRDERIEDDFMVGTGIHLVDTALSLSGRPETVRALSRPASREGVRVYQGQVACEGGAVVSLHVAPCAGVVEETYELIGDDFRILIDTQRCRLAIDCNNERIDTWQPPPGEPDYITSGAYAEAEAFLEALEGKREFGPTLEEGVEAMKVAEQLVEN